MSLPQPPLLSEIFRRQSNPKVEEIRISLGALAVSLGTTVSALSPFVREGLLKKRSEESMLTSRTMIDAVPEPALIWLKTWLLPMRAKPLFGISDVAELMNIPVREVLPLCARHDIPILRDEALGFVLSIWATRQLLLRSVRARDHAVRFDRIAILHRILEEDPEKAAAPPVFSEAWEKELARVAKLEEPARGIRLIELWEARKDAELLAESFSHANGNLSANSAGSELGDVSSPRAEPHDRQF